MNNLELNKKFVEYFSKYPECYVLIGGTAMSIVTQSLGLRTRTTKDYDIVLKENLSKNFIDAFHQFVKDGGYNNYSKSENKHHRLYRFDKPTNLEFPSMIELFSREPTNITLNFKNQHTPLHFDDSDSLSALILNDEYYKLLELGTEINIDNIPFLKLTYLIVFKAKAWVDLCRKKHKGMNVNRKDIKKHINDIFNLVSGFKENETIDLTSEVQIVMQEFINILSQEEIDYSKNINSVFSFHETLEILRKVYKLK